jgi:hypothetical protein
MLMTAALAFLLTGCAGSISFDGAPPRRLATKAAQPPAGLEKPCAKPARLPVRDLSAGEVERHWGKDRVALRECGARHDAHVKWRRNRDAKLAGESLPDAKPEEETRCFLPLFCSPPSP